VSKFVVGEPCPEPGGTDSHGREIGLSMAARAPSRSFICSIAAAALALSACTATIDGPAEAGAGGRAGGSGGKGSAGKAATGGSNASGGSGASSGEGSGGTSAGTGPGTGGTAGSDGPPSEARTGFSRLTRAEYRATIEQAFGLDPDVSLIPVDGRVGPFTSNTTVAPDPVHPYLLAGEDLAADIVPAELPACTESDVLACLGEDYRAPLERLFRRPVTDAELETWATLVTDLRTAGVSAENATRALVSAALLSPDFLFRATPAAGDDARVRALVEHLSFALWDAPPDAALLEVAARPATELSALLGVEAARLAADSRAVPILARFVAQWLHVDTDLRLADAAFARSPLYLELVALVEHALANDVSVVALVSAPQGFVHRDNLDAYELESAAGSDTVSLVTWADDSPRRGVLAQELFADSTRHPDPGRRPIFRGKLVRTSLLCDSIPAPSADLLELDDEVGDRTTDERCAGCHVMMDPIGRAFAPLDADFEETPEPAEVVDHAEVGGTYASLPELLEAVAGSRAFAECFARHWLAFFLEQPLDEVDRTFIGELADEITAGASLGDVVERSIVTLATRSEELVPWCEGS
jgi:hypothetical protein